MARNLSQLRTRLTCVREQFHIKQTKILDGGKLHKKGSLGENWGLTHKKGGLLVTKSRFLKMTEVVS